MDIDPTDAAAASPVITKPVSAAAAIRRYFFPADAKATEVMTELKALTPEDKAELAAGAAAELGLTVEA